MITWSRHYAKRLRSMRSVKQLWVPKGAYLALRWLPAASETAADKNYDEPAVGANSEENFLGWALALKGLFKLLRSRETI